MKIYFFKWCVLTFWEASWVTLTGGLDFSAVQHLQSVPSAHESFFSPSILCILWFMREVQRLHGYRPTDIFESIQHIKHSFNMTSYIFDIHTTYYIHNICTGKIISYKNAYGTIKKYRVGSKRARCNLTQCHSYHIYNKVLSPSLLLSSSPYLVPSPPALLSPKPCSMYSIHTQPSLSLSPLILILDL